MYQKVKLISKRNEVIRVVENDRAFILKTFKERKDFENECNVLSLLKKSKINVPRIIKADNNVLWLEDLGDYTFLKWYEELEDKNSSDYEEIIIKLCNWLKNFYHALSDSNNNSYVLYDVNFRRSSIPLSIAKCLMFNLISTMIKTMYEISGLSESNFFENMKPVNRLFNCQTVPEMNQQMQEILKQVCEYVELKKKDDHGHLKDDVIGFIESNYSNMNLDIPMIAEKFSITPAYLSKLFKEYSNEGLLDCINKVRLNNAKKLLKEQDISVSDIARMVGYYNSNAIIRAFKKYEGITPGKFKEMN